jgi:hypothetical protein
MSVGSSVAAKMLEKRKALYAQTSIMLRKGVANSGAIDMRAAEEKRKYVVLICALV